MATETPRMKAIKTGKGYSEGDWDAVDFPEMTDEELADMRPAKEVLPAAFFTAIEAHRKSRGRPPAEKPKKQVTLRLDEDIITKFREDGRGWQRRMNDALRKAAGL